MKKMNGLGKILVSMSILVGSMNLVADEIDDLFSVPHFLLKENIFGSIKCERMNANMVEDLKRGLRQGTARGSINNGDTQYGQVITYTIILGNRTIEGMTNERACTETVKIINRGR